MIKTIKIYDLTKQGMEFKADFNAFDRIKKILHEVKDNKYRKIDLVTDKSKRLFLINRSADFSKNQTEMQIEEIKRE